MAMFGTAARLRVRPGAEEQLRQLSEEWSDASGPVRGQVAEYLFKLEKDTNEFMLVAIFNDRESYYANAADPETDRWYRRVRELLGADPEWNDGEVIQERTW